MTSVKIAEYVYKLSHHIYTMIIMADMMVHAYFLAHIYIHKPIPLK